MSPLADQAEISAEMAAVTRGYTAGEVEETQPRLDYPPYRSSLLRHPTKDLHHADPETIELAAPCFGHRDVSTLESDLTIAHSGEPIGERILVTGRVLDGDGRPVRHQLVEIWQANAAGRYVHKRDQHPAPLDPHFTGAGRALTDEHGTYRFTTIKPGPYPWKNHRNAWRPAHIHFSLFGTEFTQRMITQMYFPGDPLFALDPIYQAIVDPAARERLVATYDHELSRTGMGHRLPLGHRPHRHAQHPARRRRRGRMIATPGQTVGPFFGFALPVPGGDLLVPTSHPRAVRLHGTVRDGNGHGIPDALVELWQADEAGRVVQQAGSLHRDGHTFTGFGRTPVDATGAYSFTTLVPGAQ